MIAAPRLRIHGEHTLPTADGQPPALPIAVIWGANASGKTNLVDAIHFTQFLLASTPELDSPIPVNPFRLEKKSQTVPSEFEWVVQIEGHVWKYAFSVNSEFVTHEVLYRERASKSELVFERKMENVRFGPAAKFDGNFGGFVAQGLLKNELFLSAAAKKNLLPMQEIYRWFKAILVITPDSIPALIAVKLDRDEQFRKFMETFLFTSGTGIESIGVEKVSLLPAQDEAAYSLLQRARAREIKQDRAPLNFQQADGKSSHLKVQFKHEGAPEVPFELEDESRGTQRLFHLAPVLHESKRSASLVVIDEVDSSLHPTLVKRFVECFLAEKTTGAQLILTTHDATLLDLEILRRDEIWFTDKDKNGATQLTSLHEFINRSDVDLDKHYLAGRFGGVPKIRLSKKTSATTANRDHGKAKA